MATSLSCVWLFSSLIWITLSVPGETILTSGLYPTAETTTRENEPEVDKMNLPRLSVVMPVWVFAKLMLTPGTGCPVSESVITPLTIVRCAKQGNDKSRHEQNSKHLRLNNEKLALNINKLIFVT